MHILMTANSVWSLVNYRQGLIETLIADGHQITVLAKDDSKSDVLKAIGCQFIPLKMDSKGLYPHREFILFVKFLYYFGKYKPDVILGYTIKNNIFGALASRMLGIPFIPNVTGLGMAFLSGSVLRKVAEQLYKIAFRKVPVVFLQNKDDRALFLTYQLVKETQVRTLPGSGIDLTRFQPSNLPCRDTSAHFLLIARLIKDKGVFEFIEAARQVRKLFPKTQFQLLGPIGAEARGTIDEGTIMDWVKDGIVEYLGVTSDVQPFIKAADCIVLPSYYREGTPRTLIEASAMARPVISTDTPGCREVVDDGLTGYLCAARSAESLYESMVEFLTLPQADRQSMGEAGRVKMEREYDQALVIKAYQEEILKCVKQ